MDRELREWLPEYVTTGVVARHCGVSKATVLRWIEKRYLSAFKLPDGHYRISRKDFSEFMKKHGIPLLHRA